MSNDLYIGFIEQPATLDTFLVEEGYQKIRTGRNLVEYEHGEHGSPNLFYSPKVMPVKKSEEEVPDWEEAGFNVVSELNINFHSSDFDAVERSNQLADKIRDSFKAVLY